MISHRQNVSWTLYWCSHNANFCCLFFLLFIKWTHMIDVSRMLRTQHLTTTNTVENTHYSNEKHLPWPKNQDLRSKADGKKWSILDGPVCLTFGINVTRSHLREHWNVKPLFLKTQPVLSSCWIYNDAYGRRVMKNFPPTTVLHEYRFIDVI